MDLLHDFNLINFGETSSPMLIGPNEYFSSSNTIYYINRLEFKPTQLMAIQNHSFSIWAVPNSEYAGSNLIFGNQRIHMLDFNVE
ncbi:MAG: hypothetical protein LBF36_00890 [Mycoplasmataceae bacterium]|jgi:hypothetical protein|nr:hypothetical protein [Mycoplasmataceae bacterium]